MRAGERVFVDSSAWIALALTRDPLHSRAVEAWVALDSAGAQLSSSLPVVLETFTFLDRNAHRDVALTWKDSLAELDRFELYDSGISELPSAWQYFQRQELHKLSAVDATSFVVMKREGIRVAFTFDHHFAAVGFRLVG